MTDFENQVMLALADIRAQSAKTASEISSINEHLRRLNGRTAKTERRVYDLEIDHAEQRAEQRGQRRRTLLFISAVASVASGATNADRILPMLKKLLS